MIREPRLNIGGNWISKLFDFQDQTIDMSEQAVFTWKDLGPHDEEGNKTNVSDPLTVGQRWSGRFVVVHDDGAPRPGWSKLQAKSYKL